MKIAFTGPESSGKTSISQAVATKLDAQWFPEYAREYLIERENQYDFEDIAKIALLQEENRTARSKEGLKIYDTEGLVLFVWSVFKYQKCSPEVENILYNQSFEHYFICSPKGVPWEYDPLREHPSQREELMEAYLHKMDEMQLPYTILEGTLKERTDLAVEIIRKLQD